MFGKPVTRRWGWFRVLPWAAAGVTAALAVGSLLVCRSQCQPPEPDQLRSTGRNALIMENGQRYEVSWALDDHGELRLLFLWRSSSKGPPIRSELEIRSTMLPKRESQVYVNGMCVQLREGLNVYYAPEEDAPMAVPVDEPTSKWINKNVRTLPAKRLPELDARIRACLGYPETPY